MSENLPTIQVTPAMAVRFARKQQLKVTSVQAREWLIRNRKEIERRLSDAAQDAIEDVLMDITLWECPEPAFDEMYRKIDAALSEAIGNHEDSNRVQLSSMSWDEDEMQDRVRCFLRHKGTGRKTLYLVVDLSFAEVDGDPTSHHPEIPYLMRLTCENGKLSATFAQRLTHTKVPRA
jgi:hypothetical protein